MPVNFNCSKKDSDLIQKIAERYYKENPERGTLEDDKISFIMDITATHCNGTPLDLEKLLAADKFNFYHDIQGIQRHLNRDTGKLMNCFHPRTYAPKDPKPRQPRRVAA